MKKPINRKLGYVFQVKPSGWITAGEARTRKKQVLAWNSSWHLHYDKNEGFRTGLKRKMDRISFFSRINPA